MKKSQPNSKFLKFFGLILSLLLTSCGDNTMTKFDWLASESAPKNYPMTVTSGNFTYQGGGSLPVPNDKIINGGWGTSVSTHIVGDELKPLPTQLDITFFSYTENEFYQGSFELPYEQILRLFQQGYYSTKKRKQITYDTIVAGVSPGGGVAVWLEGINKTTQVMYSQAKKADISWTQILDDPEFSREQYIDEVIEHELSPESLASLHKEGVPLGLWDSYQTRYNWQPNLVTENRPPKNIHEILYVNGEKDQLFYPLSSEVLNTSRAIPTYFYYTWQSPEGISFDHHFYFDTEELTAAFNKLHKIKPATLDSPVLLTVKLIEHEKGRMVEVMLQHQDELIMLSKTTMKQFKSTKRQDNKDTFYQD